MTTVAADPPHVLAEKLIAFLETGQSPAGLFGASVFCDFTMPRWRLQAAGVDLVTSARMAEHAATVTLIRV